jgi:serine/threonine protein kinase
VFYGIGFSPICSPPTTLTADQKKHLTLGLRAIHKLNVLHNDLKIDSLLVDGTGKAYIIDFGLAVRNASKDLLEEEEKRFAELISLH